MVEYRLLLVLVVFEGEARGLKWFVGWVLAFFDGMCCEVR